MSGSTVKLAGTSESCIGVTVLGSGSKGNSMVIHGRKGNLLLDAGFSWKQTLARMNDCGIDPAGIGGILISHEHGDHVQGVRLASRRLSAPVYCNRAVGGEVRRRGLEGKGVMNLFTSGSSFVIDEFTITPFSVPHDARDTVGFKIVSGSCRLGVATDLGCATQVVIHHLRECDILVLESNHDPVLLRNSSRPWSLKQRINGRHGHLSNADCMELLRTVVGTDTRHVVLAHASEECNRYELVADCVTQCLEELDRRDINARVARQDRPLSTCYVAAGITEAEKFTKKIF